MLFELPMSLRQQAPQQSNLSSSRFVQFATSQVVALSRDELAGTVDCNRFLLLLITQPRHASFALTAM
ncbi:hypothetical protein [Bradyrhizobium cenepequi]|uniref:hypothetical protein n=1 Tax=Bradyrhizobium cenepequi TaxID=2821403 RepID=UPI001CE2AA1F|nr:hypothetical protein [Bradyrhizobium cenepequi]MCA6105740.1 hypothetical protein [Bradyrhizobium cenepequi]